MASNTLNLLQRIQKWPAGLWVFSRLVCLKAPYFASIRPVFIALEPGYAKARIKKRRAVTNHIGTVHAIAMANLCEFVGGILMEISINPEMRWIPRGMNIRYLRPAKTNLVAECKIENIAWSEPQDVLLKVTVSDESGNMVSEAGIPMYISRRPPLKKNHVPDSGVDSKKT
jgi:acyl-coenzyme A thioesterase PaaI-like protein